MNSGNNGINLTPMTVKSVMIDTETKTETATASVEMASPYSVLASTLAIF